MLDPVLSGCSWLKEKTGTQISSTSDQLEYLCPNSLSGKVQWEPSRLPGETVRLYKRDSVWPEAY
jgi:hypothetical protein